MIRIVLVLLLHTLWGERPTSAPYISGDTFRAACSFIYDETGNHVRPNEVAYGDTVFVKTDLMPEFFREVHPSIASPYVLVTHNGDLPVPRGNEKMLEDPKLLCWFGTNITLSGHPKLKPIPIGLANRNWAHGSIQTMDQIRSLNSQKEILLYMNFAPNTYPNERRKVFTLFRNKPYCVVSKPKDYKSYLQDVSRSKFVLSPRGNGLDCHRTWEAMLLGAIPIVLSSTLDPVFEDLPILIIHDWKIINENFLNSKWSEMSKKEYKIEKLYFDYWLKLISSYKTSHT